MIFRRHRQRNSITWKVGSLLFLFAVVPLVVLTLIFFTFYAHARRQGVFELQAEIAKQIAANISLRLEKTAGQIQLFGQLLDLSNSRGEHLRQMANLLLEQGLDYDTVAIVDSDGKELAKVSRYYTYRPFELGSIAYRPDFWKALKGATVIGPVQISRFSRFPLVTVSAPIVDSRGKIRGVLQAGISVAKLWRLISQQRVGPGRYAYIIDARGRLIAYREMASVLQRRDLSPIRGVTDFLHRQSPVSTYKGLTGVPVIGASAPIPISGWGVVVEEPVAKAFYSLYLLSALFLGVAALTILLCMLFGYRFSLKTIVGPLRGLQQQAVDVTTRLTGEIQLKKGPREMLQLARAFNRMLQALRETTVSRDALRAEVSQRKEAEGALRSERDLVRQYLDIAGTMLLVLDRAGHVVLLNKKGCEILGYSEAEIIGKNWFEMTIEKDYRPVIEDVIKRFINGEAEGFEYNENYVVTHSGQRRLIAWRNVRLADESGFITGLLSSGEDITRRRRQEQERLRLATAIEQAAEVVTITDARGDFIYVNPAFSDVYGYGRQEVLGRRISLLASGLHDRAFFENMRRTIISGRTWKGRLKNRKKDGTLCEIDATVSPIREASGRIINYVAVQHDVSREVEMRRQLRQSQKMEAVGTLAGGVAHDFNNILGIIIGNAELAMDDLPPQSCIAENLEEILTASVRAKEVVQQLLSFSRRGDQQKKPLLPRPIVEETLKLLRASLPAEIDIHRDIPALPDAVLADATQIHQVMINLCTNAAHAMQADGGVLRVALRRVDFEPDSVLPPPNLAAGTYLKLTVEDTGCGMPPAVRQRIFEPYFTTKGVGRGTGMGLSVVHGIVEDHGGAIRVTSTAGRGTVVDVYLPVTDAEPAETPRPAGELPRGDAHLLFVDDETPLVDLGTQMLSRLGYQVTGLTSSRRALETFKSRPGAFDLLISDISMPFMSGDALVQEVKKIRPELPVILCTGYSERMTAERAESLGVCRLITKPLALNDLSHAVHQALDHCASPDARAHASQNPAQFQPD